MGSIGRQLAATEMEGVKSRTSWRTAAAGSIGINFDAAVNEGAGASSGVVLRNKKGEIEVAMVRRMVCDVPVILAEAMAIRMGVILAHDLGYKQVELETNTIIVTSCLAGRIMAKLPWI